jgi:hypothetical protein
MAKLREHRVKVLHAELIMYEPGKRTESAVKAAQTVAPGDCRFRTPLRASFCERPLAAQTAALLSSCFGVACLEHAGLVPVIESKQRLPTP